MLSAAGGWGVKGVPATFRWGCPRQPSDQHPPFAKLPQEIFQKHPATRVQCFQAPWPGRCSNIRPLRDFGTRPPQARLWPRPGHVCSNRMQCCSFLAPIIRGVMAAWLVASVGKACQGPVESWQAGLSFPRLRRLVSCPATENIKAQGFCTLSGASFPLSNNRFRFTLYS